MIEGFSNKLILVFKFLLSIVLSVVLALIVSEILSPFNFFRIGNSALGVIVISLVAVFTFLFFRLLTRNNKQLTSNKSLNEPRKSNWLLLLLRFTASVILALITTLSIFASNRSASEGLGGLGLLVYWTPIMIIIFFLLSNMIYWKSLKATIIGFFIANILSFIFLVILVNSLRND